MLAATTSATGATPSVGPDATTAWSRPGAAQPIPSSTLLASVQPTVQPTALLAAACTSPATAPAEADFHRRDATPAGPNKFVPTVLAGATAAAVGGAATTAVPNPVTAPDPTLGDVVGKGSAG
jgi:hypothetical protein